MPEINHELLPPAAGTNTQTKTNKAIDPEKLDRQMLKEMKDGYGAHTIASFQESLLAFDCLKNTFYKRDKGEDDVWKTYMRDEMVMAPATASKKIKIAEFKPFRVKKYQVKIPNSWTTDYQLTMLKYEAPNGDWSYEPFYQAFTGRVVNLELTEKQAHQLALACEAATKDGEFDMEAFAAGIDKVREAQRLAALPAQVRKLETAGVKREKKGQRPADLEPMSLADQKKIYKRFHASGGPGYPELAKEYNRSIAFIEAITNDRTLRPAQLHDTDGPSEQAIQEQLDYIAKEDVNEEDFAEDQNAITFTPKDERAAIRLEPLRKYFLALLRKAGITNGVLTLTQR